MIARTGLRSRDRLGTGANGACATARSYRNASRLTRAALDEAIAQCNRVLSRLEENDVEDCRGGPAQPHGPRLLAALDRLIEGKATHPDYAGRPVRITPAAVAKEARLSRNPLYTTHRALLAEIEVAASQPTPAADLAATVARLEARNAELRAIVKQQQIDKRNLATENLSLLHRARLAEDRLLARDREIAANKLVSGAGVCVDL